MGVPAWTCHKAYSESVYSAPFASPVMLLIPEPSFSKSTREERRALSYNTKQPEKIAVLTLETTPS